MFDVKDLSKHVFNCCNKALVGYFDLQKMFQQWWLMSPEMRLEIVMPCVIEFAVTSKKPIQYEIISSIVLSAFSFHLIDDFDDESDADRSLMLQAVTCQNVARKQLSINGQVEKKQRLATIYHENCQNILDGMQHFKSIMHTIDSVQSYEAAMVNRTGLAYGAVGQIMCAALDISQESSANITQYCTKMGLIIQAFNDYNDTFLKREGNDLMTGRINMPLLFLDALTEDTEIKEAIAHRQMLPLFYKIKAAMAHYNIRNLVIEKAFRYRCEAIDCLLQGSETINSGILADFMDATFTTYLILNKSEPDHPILNIEKDKKYTSTALYLKRSLN